MQDFGKSFSEYLNRIKDFKRTNPSHLGKKPKDLEQFFDDYLKVKLFSSGLYVSEDYDIIKDKKALSKLILNTVRDSLTEYYSLEDKTLYGLINEAKKQVENNSNLEPKFLVKNISKSFELAREDLNGKKFSKNSIKPFDRDLSDEKMEHFSKHISSYLRRLGRVKKLIPAKKLKKQLSIKNAFNEYRGNQV